MKKTLALLLAVVMIVALFAGCKPAEKYPTITWYAVGNGTPANIDSWTAKVNAYLEEKIGVHLNYKCVPWGDWGSKRSMMVQTNGDYDIVFTDMSSYAGDVNMGAFADLSELIKETPGLTDLIPADYLDACRIDGKLYSIPAYKDSSMSQFFVWTKADVEDYFPGYADGHDLDSITQGLKDIKAGTSKPPVLLNKDGISCIVGNRYDNLGTGLPALGVSYFNGDAKVVCTLEQDDVMNAFKTLHSWFQDGLINSDAATLENASGMCSLGVAQGWPSAAAGWGDGRGAEVVAIQYGDTVLSNDTVQGSMLCINASSKHQKEALKLIELVNTDTTLRDMLAYGEEGVNFNYIEENGEKRVEKLNSDWTFASYTQGTYFNLTMEKGVVGNPYHEEVAVQNDNAVRSPALGFAFDTANVADKLSACKSIMDGYKGQLFTGAGDPEVVVPKLMGELRAAGFDEILAEAQTQLDDYLAGK